MGLIVDAWPAGESIGGPGTCPLAAPYSGAAGSSILSVTAISGAAMMTLSSPTAELARLAPGLTLVRVLAEYCAGSDVGWYLFESAATLDSNDAEFAPEVPVGPDAGFSPVM
eukprot:CAMPEP_0198111540 /NCGR_PEP_ID=MMETSP1442-20131203/3506_1 /TAXON_ID= /ORGANISM="Craspedostauros australis, Strain CCMP3328" /LENGTH=111 /DNA_ID=CAMNT_0043768019 /DNA_START=272 /DNA_END=607 /DNA_ORIENTATION=+